MQAHRSTPPTPIPTPQQFEALARSFYTPSSKEQAEAFVIVEKLCFSKDTVRLAHTVLTQSSDQRTLLLVSNCLRKVVSQVRVELSLDLLTWLRRVLVELLIHRSYALPRVVVGCLVQVLAKVSKRMWLSSSQRQVDVLTVLSPLLVQHTGGASVKQHSIALDVLTEVTKELDTEGTLSESFAEYHKAKKRFLLPDTTVSTTEGSSSASSSTSFMDEEEEMGQGESDSSKREADLPVSQHIRQLASTSSILAYVRLALSCIRQFGAKLLKDRQQNSPQQATSSQLAEALESALDLLIACLSFDFKSNKPLEGQHEETYHEYPDTLRPLLTDPDSLQLLYQLFSVGRLAATHPSLLRRALMALRLFACMKPAFLVSKQHRTAWVSVLLRGQIHILTSATLQQAGVGVFHEFVRLTAQTKQALTVTMLLSVSNFPEWLQAVANLSIQALRPGSAVPFNSRYYLLELWRRVAHEKHTSPWGTLTDTPAKQFDSPATAQIGTNTIPTGPSSPLGSNPIPSPSMAGPPPASAAGHQTPAKSDIDRAQAELHRFLDGFGPRLIAAVVQSRLALLTPASGRLLPVAQAEQAMAEPDWSEELKTFPFIARLCLHSTYTLLSSQLEACLALHRRETSLSPRASPPSSSSSSSSSSSTTPSSAPSDGLATITSIELRIAVLLYFAAAAVGTDKFHTDPYHPANTLPANTRAWPQDIEAGLCALCFCCLTPLTRPLRAHHQSGLQPFALGTRPAFPSLPRQAELAVLFWFQQLQAKYLGNTSPYEQCTTRPSSLFADRKAKVAGIWKRVSEVNCSAGGVVGPTLDEQEVLNRVVERLLQNLAGKTEFPGQFTETAGAVEVDDEVLDASLALFESLSSEYLTGRQVCNLPCVKALLTAGPGLNLRFSALVRADSLKHKSRLTTLYHILAMLLFRWQHTKSQPFAPNTVPPVCPSDALWLSFTKFIRCFEPSFHKLQRGTATAVDASTLFRQLRGLLQGANDSPPYLLIHQALFPDAWPVFSDTLRRFHCSSPVVISFLRFLSELVHNTSRRVDFGKNSPQGLIMVRKVADMLTEIILSLHRASAERVPCQDLYRERLKPLALSLEVLHRCWTGGYVNFGIFTLYEDKCVDKLTKSILSLLPLPSGISAPSAKGRENLSLLCTPTGPDGKARANASSHSFLNGLLGHPKLRRLLFTWLNTCTGQHLGCIIDTDPEVFQQLLMAFYLGLQTQDSPHQTGKVSSLAQVCTCLDHLLSFFHQLQHKKQLMESQEGETDQAQGQGTALATGEQGGLLGSANYLSEEEQRQWAQLQAHLVRGGGERLLQQIFNTLFDLALFTDHPNLWLLADPLLCLLVIQPSVLPTYQKALEQADQTSQLLSARLSSALGKLTKGVGRNLEKDNKSRFYDNLTALINSLNTHAIPV